MKNESKLARLLLVSPWFLLVFLAVPIAVILNLTAQARIPLVGPQSLLINNICFTFLIACRLLRYLAGMRKRILYGPGFRRPRHTASIELPVPEARRVLIAAGYSFTDDGGYGEKRDPGYFGTTILYGGLLVLLAVGSWDNLRQFSGVLLDGVGPATKLNRLESYRRVSMGPLAAGPDSLPQMRIIRQMLPGESFPKGATEIALLPGDGAPLTKTLKPTDPYRYGAYDIYMKKMVFEPQIVIKNKYSRTLYDAIVKLDPLVQKRGVFSFYGLFTGSEVVGGVYFQPETSLMKVVITQNDKRVVADMKFQVDQQVTAGDYVLSCAKLGQWSEIHVVRRRHKGLLLSGGIIALIGLVTRLAIRPRRVWLEGDGAGSRATAVGAETKKLLMLN